MQGLRSFNSLPTKRHSISRFRVPVSQRVAWVSTDSTGSGNGEAHNSQHGGRSPSPPCRGRRRRGLCTRSSRSSPRGINKLGTPHYTLTGTFDCTAFLERLRGGFGYSRLVNYSDCAAIVATFANAPGCDLWQSRMIGAEPFLLNPTLTIGSHAWLSACAVGAFVMHKVAWTNGCGEDDDVFDAVCS
jgi:hypothetical protein